MQLLSVAPEGKYSRGYYRDHCNIALIDTPKIKHAIAASAHQLCRNTFSSRQGDHIVYCVLSALAIQAGVSDRLWEKMVPHVGLLPFAYPILEAEYGMPPDFSSTIPEIFDNSPNEWVGVRRVLEACEEYNLAMLYAHALSEDGIRLFRSATVVRVATLAVIDSPPKYGEKYGEWHQKNALAVVSPGRAGGKMDALKRLFHDAFSSSEG